MACTQIRRLTPMEKKYRAELRAERYDVILAELQAQELHEYNESFGPTYRAKYSFRQSHTIHDRVEHQLRVEEAAYFESRIE